MIFILYHPRHMAVFESRADLRRMPVPRANTDVYAVYETIAGPFPDRSRVG